MTSLARRRALLLAAVGFLGLDWKPGRPRTVAALDAWLGGWPGIGLIVAGMHAQGYDLELRQFPRGWRANFYATGTAHSVVAGTGWEPTPASAVQRAAWGALRARPADERAPA